MDFHPKTDSYFQIEICHIQSFCPSWKQIGELQRFVSCPNQMHWDRSSFIPVLQVPKFSNRFHGNSSLWNWLEILNWQQKQVAWQIWNYNLTKKWAFVGVVDNFFAFNSIQFNNVLFHIFLSLTTFIMNNENEY